MMFWLSAVLLASNRGEDEQADEDTKHGERLRLGRGQSGDSLSSKEAAAYRLLARDGGMDCYSSPSKSSIPHAFHCPSSGSFPYSLLTPCKEGFQRA